MPQGKLRHGLQFGDRGGPDEDSELILLGAGFQEKQRRYLELTESQPGSAGTPSRQDHEEILSLMQARQELAELIAGLRATTVPGLQTKAAVLLAYSQYDLDGKLHWTDHDELMGWSIARDLLGDEAAQPT